MALGTFCCHVWYCETMSALLTSGTCQHWEWGANKRKYETHTLAYSKLSGVECKAKVLPSKGVQDSAPQWLNCFHAHNLYAKGAKVSYLNNKERHMRNKWLFIDSFCLHSVWFALIKPRVSRVYCNLSSKMYYHPAFAVITIFLNTSLEEHVCTLVKERAEEESIWDVWNRCVGTIRSDELNG